MSVFLWRSKFKLSMKFKEWIDNWSFFINYFSGLSGIVGVLCLGINNEKEKKKFEYLFILICLIWTYLM